MLTSRLLALLVALLAWFAAPALVTPAAAAGDDYPYRTSASTRDPWGFTKRQCVSFAAWRLAQAGRPINNYRQGWGNAYNWNNNAARLGKRVTRQPRVGAIAQWNSYERARWYANGSPTPNGYLTSGRYGHVAVVQRVYADGSVRVEHYNMHGSRAYSTARIIAPRYLYL